MFSGKTCLGLLTTCAISSIAMVKHSYANKKRSSPKLLHKVMVNSQQGFFIRRQFSDSGIKREHATSRKRVTTSQSPYGEKKQQPLKGGGILPSEAAVERKTVAEVH